MAYYAESLLVQVLLQATVYMRKVIKMEGKEIKR